MPDVRATACAFCRKPTTAEPLRPRRSSLSYRDVNTHTSKQVQMPREVVLCERCQRDVSLLAGCPRCRRYGRYHDYGAAPYGSSCDECGGSMWLMSGETPFR